MTEYFHFRSEDFASDDFFKSWVLTPDSYSEQFWESFIKDNPEKYYEIIEARTLIKRLSNTLDSTYDIDQEKVIWQKIEQGILIQDQRISRNFTIRRISMFAASITIVGFLVYFLYHQKVKESYSITDLPSISAINNLEIYNNDTSSPQEIILKDRSRIILNPKSQIKYSHLINKHLREAELKGSALFEIKRNEQNPFIVKAGGTITTVLGTKFSINANDITSNVIIAVISGKVAINNTENTKSVILTANQQATYSKKDNFFLKTTKVNNRIISDYKSSQNTIFIFKDSPIQKIFEAIENEYNIQIVYNKVLMKDCYLTINLNNENMDEKLEVISKALSVGYSKHDDKVIFESKNCN